MLPQARRKKLLAATIMKKGDVCCHRQEERSSCLLLLGRRKLFVATGKKKKVLGYCQEEWRCFCSVRQNLSYNGQEDRGYLLLWAVIMDIFVGQKDRRCLFLKPGTKKLFVAMDRKGSSLMVRNEGAVYCYMANNKGAVCCYGQEDGLPVSMVRNNY